MPWFGRRRWKAPGHPSGDQATWRTSRNFHPRDKREIWNRFSSREGGSKGLRKPLRTHSSGTGCGQTSPRRIKLSNGHSGALASATWTALPVNRVCRIDSQSFGSCCVDASDSQFFSVRAPADVAASWTSMAIIEQRVRKQGFWVKGFSLGVCSGTSLQRSRSASVDERDLDIADHTRLDGRRLEVVADGLTLWRGAQFAIDTTLVSLLHQDGSARSRTHTTNGAVLENQEGADVPRTRRREVRHIRWSWHWRSEADGQARLRSFCKDWPRLAPSLCLGSFKSVWQPHGSNVVVASWRAAQRVRSRRPCWSADQPLAREARFPR